MLGSGVPESSRTGRIAGRVVGSRGRDSRGKFVAGSTDSVMLVLVASREGLRPRGVGLSIAGVAAEINGSLIARRGRVVALFEVSSANVKVRDGGLHVLRVGDERSCNAFLLPRASGQSRCDRLIFMLLREAHALNCGRPLRAERMVDCKWLSRSF